MKLTALFVDDDRFATAALRRSMRPLRATCDFAFADSGRQALEMLANSPRDIVFTDMRMPKMDGAELLARVRQTHPATIRVVISGQAGQAARGRATNLAHRYFAKPCDPDTITEVIEQIRNLRKLVPSDELYRSIVGVATLPCEARSVDVMKSKIADDTLDSVAIQALVKRDAGVLTGVLRLANACMVSDETWICDIDQACRVINSEEVNLFVRGLDACLNCDELQEANHRVSCVADLCQELAEKILPGRVSSSDARLVGGLHRTEELLELAFETPLPQSCDAQCAAFLLATWGVPERIYTAVGNHQSPTEDADWLTTMLHIATNAYEHCTSGASSLDVEHLAKREIADIITPWYESVEVDSARVVSQR